MHLIGVSKDDALASASRWAIETHLRCTNFILHALEQYRPSVTECPTYREQVRRAQAYLAARQSVEHNSHLYLCSLYEPLTQVCDAADLSFPESLEGVASHLQRCYDDQEEGWINTVGEYTLKDLGYTLEWHDPDCDEACFQRSKTFVEREVQIGGKCLSIPGLLEYGLVPTDMSPAYQRAMVDAGFLPEPTEAFRRDYNSDWRCFLRSGTGRRHWCAVFQVVPKGVVE